MDARKVKAGSRDAINCIPDEILAKILSFLPTKRAASTSLVSKRWRNLFTLVIQLFASQHHFYLDDSDLVYPEDDKRESKDVHHESFKAFVDRTFSGCNSIKKLSLKCTLISSAHTNTNQWLHQAMERGVVELNLRFKMGFTPQQTEWPFGFTFKTVVKLTLGIECGHKYQVSFCPNVVLLPVLKSLFLNTICYACELLYRRMLLGCPILEELSLHFLRGKSGRWEAAWSIFSICHKTLKRLKVQCNNSLDYHFCRYMQLNTPNLLYLDYSGFTLMPSCPNSISLASLVEAKLDIHKQRRYDGTVHLSKMIDWMSNVKTLSLSPASVKEMHSRCVELLFFTNLVMLYFESNEKEGWEVVLPRLLNKSPKLETLALKGLHCVSKHGVCIDRNEVKVLEIYGFRGGREMRQVKRLLRQMQFLQVMKVEIDAEADDNKKLRLIDHLLALPKPSSKFQIQFL